MTTPTPEQQAKARDIKHYKYVGGGMYRDSRVPQGETADVIHGKQMMEVIAALIVAERDYYREKAARYEYVRTLKPEQFKALFNRNIAGEGHFDCLVDAAINAAKK